MQAALAGSQHGVSFFREVGIGEIGDEENEKQTLVLEGSQVGSTIHDAVPGNFAIQVPKMASLPQKPSSWTCFTS